MRAACMYNLVISCHGYRMDTRYISDYVAHLSKGDKHRVGVEVREVATRESMVIRKAFLVASDHNA